MYNCGVCGESSKPGQTAMKHIVYRVVNGRREIAKEIPCCEDCKGGLNSGYSLKQVREWAEQSRLRDEVNRQMAALGKAARFV